MVVPEDKAFIEVTVHHRNARFDNRVSKGGYVALEKTTEDKPGGYWDKGSVSIT
jgi:hypothetical protein